MGSFGQMATKLSPRGWLSAGAAGIGAIVILYLLLQMVSAPSYTTLLTGLEPAQTGKMTAALSQKGISYELQNNGTALAVQSNQTAQARVALAGAGLLEGNQQGFSLFDKSELGESTFQQQVTYQRALQGQLAQTIDQIQGVSGAQVELVLPNTQNQLFSENQAPPSAAVLLGGSGALEPATVRGIAHLVASSVPGLKTSNVTITGPSGQLLWPAAEGGEGAEGTSRQAAQQRYDQQMDSTIGAMLNQIVGPGKAQVQVYAEMNVNKTTQEQLTYGTKGVPLQESTNVETLQGSGGAAGGAAGTAAIPGYAQTGTGKSNYKHEVTTKSLGVDKTVTHQTIAPGEVTKEHVSVLLDRSVPASAVPAIREAVSNAAGIEAKRGDTLYIGQMTFSKATATTPGSSSSMLSYAKDLLAVIAAAVFIFFTTRFLRKREALPIEQDPPWLRNLEGPVRLAELEREVGAAGRPGNGNAGAPGAPVGAGASTTARQRIEELASSNPEQIAGQLRSWMSEE
jgi:flagellar M-ring protein FliF